MPAGQPRDLTPDELISLLNYLKAGNYRAAQAYLDGRVQGELGAALADLADALALQARQFDQLNRLRAQINTGLLFDEVMENVYEAFRELIPYNRIGVALLDEQGMVRARWARSDRETVALGTGYAAPLAGSSLATILETGEPRILNDLQAYLASKPQSQSTRLIVKEGMRSSLTCPLVVAGEPVGFLFFSSIYPNAYAPTHSEIFMSLADELSGLLEKGRMASELAENARAIAERNERLRHLDELKNTFLGIVAHDLRNPLSFIKTASDMLLLEEEDSYLEQRERVLGGISRQVNNMLALVDDLLQLSEIESGKIQLDLENLPVKELLWETVLTQGQLAAPKGTRLELAAIPSELQVRADANRLRQVVENLVSNAIKYSPPHSTIRLWVETQDEYAWFGIQDEGPGVAVENREALFQPFVRLGTRPTGGEESIGLGLAIARWLVEANGGQIGVKMAPRRGSIFWFTLPLVPGQSPEAGV